MGRIQNRVVGRCYLCQAPVRANDAARVADPSTLVGGHLLRRLVHAGVCQQDLRARIARG